LEPGLGTGYIRSGDSVAKGPDMSGLTGDFCGKIDFDDLHLTNSPNASPLIVRSS
jgi:hypothetical protein